MTRHVITKFVKVNQNLLSSIEISPSKMYIIFKLSNQTFRLPEESVANFSCSTVLEMHCYIFRNKFLKFSGQEFLRHRNNMAAFQVLHHHLITQVSNKWYLNTFLLDQILG
ncbi:hypothetical protein OTU49_009764 [Cherax quadricarinatus]|uniref:Uncharacterized protein n=1 Tax=Cherax quadricarinatus TaxID=27406 RepID=A0AAW0WHU3_CHEQU